MSDMPRCKTCKHWGGASYAAHERVRYCERLSNSTPRFQIVLNPESEEIETDVDFGCVEHEAQP